MLRVSKNVVIGRPNVRALGGFARRESSAARAFALSMGRTVDASGRTHADDAKEVMPFSTVIDAYGGLMAWNGLHGRGGKVSEMFAAIVVRARGGP